jgi:hypothetical protein
VTASHTHNDGIGAGAEVLDHVEDRLALRAPRGHDRVLRGRDGLRHRLAVVEVVLGVVGGRHGVGSVEAEQVRGAAHDALLEARAAAEPEVVQAEVQAPPVLLVHRALVGLFEHLSRAPAQRRHRAAVPHVLGDHRLQERHQPRVLPLRGDLVHRRMNVRTRPLWQRLDSHREVSIVFLHPTVRYEFRHRAAHRKHILERT